MEFVMLYAQALVLGGALTTSGLIISTIIQLFPVGSSMKRACVVTFKTSFFGLIAVGIGIVILIVILSQINPE